MYYNCHATNHLEMCAKKSMTAHISWTWTAAVKKSSALAVQAVCCPLADKQTFCNTIVHRCFPKNIIFFSWINGIF